MSSASVAPNISVLRWFAPVNNLWLWACLHLFSNRLWTKFEMFARQYHCSCVFHLLIFTLLFLGGGHHRSQAAGQGVSCYWWFGRLYQSLCPAGSWCRKWGLEEWQSKLGGVSYSELNEVQICPDNVSPNQCSTPPLPTEHHRPDHLRNWISAHRCQLSGEFPSYF